MFSGFHKHCKDVTETYRNLSISPVRNLPSDPTVAIKQWKIPNTEVILSSAVSQCCYFHDIVNTSIRHNNLIK